VLSSLPDLTSAESPFGIVCATTRELHAEVLHALR
jgi:hypothetical protein